MRVWVYIDGFNLYHGVVKRPGGRDLKWLDLLKLGQVLRPNDIIERVKYFTALVEKRVGDPTQQQRQRIYWRALKTIPCIERIEGRFSRGPKSLPLYHSVLYLEELEKQGRAVDKAWMQFVVALRSEEKGTDVNLAAHLVHDANQADSSRTFEAALILSTDSDLTGAIKLVTQEVGKQVHICKPEPRNLTVQLENAATNTCNLKTKHLKASQFPTTLSDARGPIIKPSSW